MQNSGGHKKLIMVFSKVANGNLYTSVLYAYHTHAYYIMTGETIVGTDSIP